MPNLQEHQNPVRQVALFSVRAVMVVCLIPAGAYPAEESVFDLPHKFARVQQMRPVIVALMRQKKFAEAEPLAVQSTELLPDDPLSFYYLACTESRLGNTQQAIDHLGKAIELGFRRREIISADANLLNLHVHRKWNDILNQASQPGGQRRKEIVPSNDITVWPM